MQARFLCYFCFVFLTARQEVTERQPLTWLRQVRRSFPLRRVNQSRNQGHRSCCVTRHFFSEIDNTGQASWHNYDAKTNAGTGGRRKDVRARTRKYPPPLPHRIGFTRTDRAFTHKQGYERNPTTNKKKTRGSLINNSRRLQTLGTAAA